MPTDSGRPHGIYRCPTCGTAVWIEYAGPAALRFVRVGMLDDPRALAPDLHIYVRSKQPWVRLPEGVPAFEAYYDSQKLWRRPTAWPGGGPPSRGRSSACRAQSVAGGARALPGFPSHRLTRAGWDGAR
jgi:hypothetical protein